VPSQLAKSLLERSPLEATDHEQFRRLDQVFLSFFFGPALSGDVKRRAMGDIPFPLSFESAEQPEFCLNSDRHIAKQSRARLKYH